MPTSFTQSTSTTTPDPCTLEQFDQQITEMTKGFSYARLPDVDLAMWPSDVRFFDDISDPRFFNDRFIEADAISGKLATPMYISMMISNIFLFLTVYCFIEEHYFYGPERNIYPLSFAVIAVMLSLIGISLFFFPPLKVRFNRQAQLVHSSAVDHPLPWRYVQPVSNYNIGGLDSNMLYLTFPPPKGKEELYEETPLMVCGIFKSTDTATYGSNLDRFEFIRLYMEHGLAAIEPKEGTSPESITKPSGFLSSDHIVDIIKKRDVGGIIAHFFFLIILYIPGYGPLIDWYLKRRSRKFRWPEEVERLCAPGADLSGYDTTPVRARRDFFYRFDGSDIHFVDANGHRIG